MAHPLRRGLAAGFTLLVLALTGCSSATESSPTPSMAGENVSPAPTPVAGVSQGSTFGQPSGLWDIPRDVQVAYFKAVCNAPASEFGLGGTFNDSTEKCRSSNDMESDVDFGVRSLLASDAVQMSQATQLMIEQSGASVPECPTLEEYRDATSPVVTNECAIAAMKALTAYLSD